MSFLVEHYANLAKQNLATDPWLMQLQKSGIEDLQRVNFPTRHDEDWKYSGLDKFLKHEFVLKQHDADKHAFEIMALGEHNNAPFGVKIPCINGEVMGLTELRAKLPSAVIIEPISDAIIKYPDIVKNHLNQILTPKHGMHALNSAMLKQGLFIYVPENLALVEPILLNHVNTEDNTAVFLRHLVVVGKGSTVKIIEDYQSVQDYNSFTNVITEIIVAEHAEVEHFTIQREGSKSFYFGHIFVKQLADSQYANHLLNLGGQWSRADIDINLTEKNARCLLNGVYMPVNEQYMESKTFVNHAVANCYSEQDYRGVADDNAQAAFNGKIYVAKDAISTEARQQNRNLLLANSAKVYSKPQLEIFADDVSCTHGATVGQLDEEALFYFATRGIAESEARRYLLHAFADANLSKVANKATAAWMRTLLEKQMR